MTDTTHGDPIDTIMGEIAAALRVLDRSGIHALAELAMRGHRVFVTGEGRSGYLARAFAMRLMHLGTQVYFVGDTCTPAVASGDVMVAVSGSGATASTLRTMKAAAANGCQTVAVTSDPSSELATMADVVLHVPGATKHRRKGEPSTSQPLSSLFDQCVHIALDAVCLTIANSRRIDNATAVRAHANTE